MKMRTMKPEQLKLVFADSPQGGGGVEVPDLWGKATSRLHTTNLKEFERFKTGATDASSLLSLTGLRTAACAVRSGDTVQRAGCVIRQSGSERGAVVQTTVPTRQGQRSQYERAHRLKEERKAPRGGRDIFLESAPLERWVQRSRAGRKAAVRARLRCN
jgi:hypothetical protein